MSDFNVVEVDNPELKSGDKGTSTGANLTSNPIDANTEALHVDGSKVTQPVSVASLPLPAGAATEATLEAARALLATIDADTSNLDVLLSTRASETKLEAVRALLQTIDVDTSNIDVLLSTRASETKLAAVRALLETIDNVLDTIYTRLGDGNQKTQIVGEGGDDLDIDPNGMIAVKVHDQEGNAYLIADGIAIPVGTRGPLIMGKNYLSGNAKNLTTIVDPVLAAQQRLQTEARLAPGSTVSIGNQIPADPQDFVLMFLEKSGGGHNMLVDGSSTPVEFLYAPSAGEILALQSLLIVFTADDFEFNGASFGPNTALSNGIKVELTVSSVTTEIFNITQNEDYLRTPGRLPLINNTGPKDLLGAEFAFGGLIKLIGDDSDKISLTVRDNLTSVKLKYLTATVFGVNE